jgi:hypothetical protein
MNNNDRLNEIGEMLASFVEGQHLTPELYAEIQHILDSSLVLLVESGAYLPTFMMSGDRLDSARRRLGAERIAALIDRPLDGDQRNALLPLAARLCDAFDTLPRPNKFGVL